MGRYTTVQTFSDQDANNVAISYASETASINIDASNTTANQDRDSSKKEDKFQVNRVENVSGSSAGAGSGDFHMYRSSRRRELERIEKLEKEHQQKIENEEFEAKRKRNAEEFEAKAKKRADRRKRRKENAKAKANDDCYQNDKDSGKQNENNKDKSPQNLPETLTIPNDGSFLERMIAFQAQK